MKDTLKLLGIIVLSALIGFSLLTCSNPSDSNDINNNTPQDFSLSGDVTISVQGGGDAIFGCTLIATYSGAEDVSFTWHRWYMDDYALLSSTGTTLLTDSVGSYTVEVWAEGYSGKGSEAFYVGPNALVNKCQYATPEECAIATSNDRERIIHKIEDRCIARGEDYLTICDHETEVMKVYDDSVMDAWKVREGNVHEGDPWTYANNGYYADNTYSSFPCMNDKDRAIADATAEAEMALVHQ